MDEENEREKLVTFWHTFIKKSTDFDLWGQPVEANESYQRLIIHMKEEIKTENIQFTDDERKVLNKVVACLELRSKALQNPGKIEGIGLEDLKLIANRLRALLSTSSKDFPVDVAGLQQKSRQNDDVEETANSSRNFEDTEEYNALDAISHRKFKGTILPALPSEQGHTQITVRVDKIGLKDATQYLESFMSISIRDACGKELCVSQDTPQASHQEDTHVLFGVDVFLQQSLESLPEDAGVFFEFKHYKPKKKQLSTKCWALMEKDEIKEGLTVIELYKKPVDYKRKKINLLTVKPLYLHLKLTLNS